MCCTDEPIADNEPFTVNVRVAEFPCTTTPGSIVNVTPDATVTSPVITYGLFASVHVVLDEIIPDTLVGPVLIAGDALRGTPRTTATRKSALLAFRDHLSSASRSNGAVYRR